MTICITVKTKNGQYIRDIQIIESMAHLIHSIQAHIDNGNEIIATEELEGDVLDFYSSGLSDDDIDAMAAIEMDEIA